MESKKNESNKQRQYLYNLLLGFPACVPLQLHSFCSIHKNKNGNRKYTKKNVWKRGRKENKEELRTREEAVHGRTPQQLLLRSSSLHFCLSVCLPVSVVDPSMLYLFPVSVILLPPPLILYPRTSQFVPRRSSEILISHTLLTHGALLIRMDPSEHINITTPHEMDTHGRICTADM